MLTLGGAASIDQELATWAAVAQQEEAAMAFGADPRGDDGASSYHGSAGPCGDFGASSYHGGADPRGDELPPADAPPPPRPSPLVRSSPEDGVRDTAGDEECRLPSALALLPVAQPSAHDSATVVDADVASWYE